MPTPSSDGSDVLVPPQPMVSQLGKHLGRPDALPRFAVDHAIAGDDKVPAPQIDRVDVQLRGQLVEQGLDGERGLRTARPSV